jgi:tetratricopeptide (TPR) repeat protein
MIVSPGATLRGYGWLDTISHELVHMMVSEKTKNQTPVWLQEALARLEDSRWRSQEPAYQGGLSLHEESRLAQALSKREWITFEQKHPSMALLPNQEAVELAFSEVYMAARYLVERKGYQGIRQMLSRIDAGDSDFEAIHKIYGLGSERFFSSFLSWLRKQPLRTLSHEKALEESVEKSLSRQKEPELRDYFHLGELLRARGRHAASSLEYQKAVDRAGKNHAVLPQLTDKWGLSLLALGRIPEAAAVFQRSIEVHPQDLEARLHLAGILLEHKQDPDGAWRHLQECVRVNPLDPRVHRLMLQVAEKMQQGQERQENWPVLVKRHKRALQLLSGVSAEGR